jgi:hypothetical protein
MSRAVMQQALDALMGLIEWDKKRKFLVPYRVSDPIFDSTIALNKELTKPDQEPLTNAAPDLLQELISLRRAYINLLYVSHDRIIDLGGTCDDVKTMIAGSHYLRDAAAAIARATEEEA